jgi:SAM-dependent methyltransferase
VDASDWDARYAASDLVWSAGPNVWVRELCAPMAPARALDVAAGEGRNALWLVERGWTVTAADYSSVAVARLVQIADERLDEHSRDRLHAVVADATEPAPGTAHDLVLFSYLHLAAGEWRRAVAAGVEAATVGGHVLVLAHARRNLTAGVGGPQDPAILLDPEDVLASVADLPVAVALAQLRARDVTGASRPALDSVVLLRRTAEGRR